MVLANKVSQKAKILTVSKDAKLENDKDHVYMMHQHEGDYCKYKRCFTLLAYTLAYNCDCVYQIVKPSHSRQCYYKMIPSR